jgi:hypothetical protein
MQLLEQFGPVQLAVYLVPDPRGFHAVLTAFTVSAPARRWTLVALLSSAFSRLSGCPLL